jgi:hypothetical protein
MAKEIYQPHVWANLMPMQSPGSARSKWMQWTVWGDRTYGRVSALGT